MSNLQDIKLVPRDPSKGSFVRKGMTIQLDERGTPELIEDQTALEQDILKAIFTGVCSDGYGTVVQQILGDKNIGVSSAMLVFTVIGSLQAMIRAHNVVNLQYPTRFRLRRLLDTVEFIRVKEFTVESLVVQMEFRTKAQTLGNLTQTLVSGRN